MGDSRKKKPGGVAVLPDLSVQLGPLKLRHPLINASGTFDIFEVAEALGSALLDDPPVAAYVPKTVTPLARRGNEPPRILETAAGMLNAIGLPNEGLAAFVSNDLTRLLALPCPLVLNVGGFSPEDYWESARVLAATLDEMCGGTVAWLGRVGLELNISCPNVHSGCMSIGTDPVETRVTVEGVRRVWPGLLIVKLTPNVTDIAPVAQAAEAAGADALSLVNTFKGLALDRTTLRPYLGNVTGGLSGPAIKPLALRFVYEAYQAVQIPLVGMGGVATIEDVLDMMACGARAVAVGAAAFSDPWLAARLAVELRAALRSRGTDVAELIGCAHRLRQRPSDV
jgi:dihydroorotate dehydrogenase (NAD+) catalytic subunit